MEQFAAQAGRSAMQGAVLNVANCANCYKPIRPDARRTLCTGCRAKMRLMYAATQQPATQAPPQPPKQPVLVAACAVCSARVQLPPYPIDPKQIIICVPCHNTRFSKTRRRETQRRAEPSAPHTHAPPAPQQGTHPKSPADLDDVALAQYIAFEAMKYVHPAHTPAEMGGLGADYVRIAPEGAMIAPASMLPPTFRPSPDGRHYNERGEILVPPIASYLPMPLPPPPPPATPSSHKFYTQRGAVPPANRPGSMAAPTTIPTRPPGSVPFPQAQVAHAPSRPAPRSSFVPGASTASVPSIRRVAPGQPVAPSHLVRLPPGQPVMLQHYHAAVPPPVQPGSDGMVQGWTSGDPQAAGKVRVCETSGCSTVLSAKHLWRVCSRCLAAADPGHFAAVPSKRGREKSMDASASASPSASAGGEVAASDELNKPRLRVAMQASASSASETPPTEPHHHVFPLSASSQTSPSVQVPIARSRRSASVELVVSPGVNPGPRNQPPISIPSLFSQPISQNARTKHRQTSSLTNALAPSHFPNHVYPLQDPTTSNGQGAFDQKPDTDAMLEQLESLVREHVGVARIPALTPDAARAQHSAERIRGGAGSSPVGVPPKLVEPSLQPQVRSVPLPLPRKMKNIAGPSKATASASPAADQSILLDDDGDVPMLPEPPTPAVEPTAASRNETENGGSTDADVVMSDVNTNAEPTHSLDPHTQGPFRDVAINNAPARAEPSQLTVPVKAEQATEPSFTTVAEHDEDVRMSPEPVAGDTSEEDEPPLSVVVKSKRDMENTDEEKPVARINLRFKTTTPSTYRSQSTPKTGSTPLRIRIPSFKKSSPPRVDVSLAPPSTPPVPESLAAPSSPTSPTQPTTGVNTPWDSDLSDLTPIEDLTDEGESEIGEPEDDAEEKPKLKIKLKIPKSLQGSKGRPVRLVPSRKEDKSPSTCNIRRCQNMLAPGYRYKMCDICREHNRVGQRRMRAAEKADDPYAKSKKHLVDLSGYPPGSRICVGKWCKTVVPPESEYKWKMCVACRQAYRKQDNYAAIFEHPALLNGKKQTREGDGLDLELQYPDDDDDGFPYVDRTPNAYQHLGDLLQMLERRFHAFFVAQLQYYQFKIGRGVDVTAATPSMFSFTGEYSIVANPAGGTVNEAVKALASQVEGALGIRFNPAGIFMGPEASVVSRFGCVHEVNMPFPQVKSEPSAPDTPAPVLVRRMAGELEIDVSWDRRHKYFPGQRIQIRFKLLS